jgi:prepilin-type N-terminal cleavage/methylation domain-containing protein
MKREKGFTLIELVMVIVLLGILAAVAIPRFVDLGASADRAAANGGVGGIQSGISIYNASQLVAGNTPIFPVNPLASNVVTGMDLAAGNVATCLGSLTAGQWGVDSSLATTLITYRWKSDGTFQSTWSYSGATGAVSQTGDGTACL